MKIKYLIKLFSIYFAYLLKRQKTNYPPIKLWIETSSRCNLKCGLCINRNLPLSEKKDMDFNLFKKIIDQVKDYVYEVNLFHRGEPLLNPDIVEMVEYAAQSKIKTRLYTNAVLLTPDISERLIRSGLDLVAFSFDGYTKEVYEKNRCGSVFEETLENIICFLKIRRKLGLKKPCVNLLTMEYDSNTSSAKFSIQKKEFIKRFKDLPLDTLIARTPHNWGGSLDIKRHSKDKKANTKIVACTFPWYALAVFFNGKVTPCPQDFYGNLIVGDVNMESVAAIFNNEKMQNIRRGFKSKNIENLSICKNCDRCRRKTVFGVPKEYLGKFVKNNILKS
ncbi:MAG: radical SAM protein [Candidatus Humimicrobiaceae bacterium]